MTSDPSTTHAESKPSTSVAESDPSTVRSEDEILAALDAQPEPTREETR